MENGFRDKETLTKKDMVFAGVNTLATEDKRTLRGVDRLKYVMAVAEALYEWVQGTDSGKPDPDGDPHV